MNELYQFNRLSAFLTERGYPELQQASDFQVIKRDLTHEEKGGNIVYRDDGIYLINEGEQQGYMYMKEYNIEKYGDPKAHLIACSTIQQQKARKRFDGVYFWTNAAKVDVKNRHTHEMHKDICLDICKNCKKEVKGEAPPNTEAFHQKLLDELPAHLSQPVQTDVFGYTFDWPVISKRYRDKVNFTCEKCGLHIKRPGDRRFVHVHHKNGDKTNNQASNLTALCILCHTCQDDGHFANLTGGRMMPGLLTFLKAYHQETIDNPCRQKVERYANKT
jgi:hypothetical protein